MRKYKHYKSKEGYECTLGIYFSPPESYTVRIIKDGNTHGIHLGVSKESFDEADNLRDKIANVLELAEILTV